LGRPRDQHLNNRELDALVPSSGEAVHEVSRLSAAVLREAWWHAESCAECGRKVWKYRQLVNHGAKATIHEARGAQCPELNDDDWREVAAGLWPESKATQLISHAALCDHCGPMLRRGVSVDDPREGTSEGAGFAATPAPALRSRWAFTRVLFPVLALGLVVGVLISRSWSPGRPFSGAKFAEFAVNTHRQHAQGKLALGVQSGSQQELNAWLKAKSPFSVALPASPSVAGEERPFDLQGAQLVPVGGQAAAYIAYQVKMPTLQTAAASLIVTPDSVAVASGGIEVDFKKVSFHYSTVEGYKVVTWSVHGLTYALVSEEGNSTQRSCMVCHSAMKDRDLSQTPAPLHLQGNLPQPAWW